LSTEISKAQNNTGNLSNKYTADKIWMGKKKKSLKNETVMTCKARFLHFPWSKLSKTPNLLIPSSILMTEGSDSRISQD